MSNISDLIEEKIIAAIEKENEGEFSFDGDKKNIQRSKNPFEELIGFGELVDRLSIVNQKLYDLKNQVMKKSDDINFLSQAAIKDVALVVERSRLKKCLDDKVVNIANRVINGQNDGGINAETKSYE